MPRPRRPARSAESSLAQTLKRVLALSLSTPLATTAACRSSDPSAPTVDGSIAARVDAAGEASADDGGPDEASVCAAVPMEAGFFGEDGSCGKFIYLPCGVPEELRGVGCDPSPDFCAAVCPEGFFFICNFPAPTCEDGGVPPDAAIYLDCTTCLGNVGRRPVGLLPPPRGRDAVSPIATYLARAAYMERASVEAFLQLRARLAEHGAPARFQRAALGAAKDEARHARITGALTRRLGGSVETPRPCPPVPLTLAEVALENAVEGCIRETFAALIGLHQAARAPDPDVASTMRRIAKDEVRHAELAWAIHRWAAPRLGRAWQRRARAAQTVALAELRAAAGAWPDEVIQFAGLPDRPTEQRLLRHFTCALLPGEPPKVLRTRRRNLPTRRGIPS